MGEISITKLLVVAALVVLLFGTKKLRTLGWRPRDGNQGLQESNERR